MLVVPKEVGPRLVNFREGQIIGELGFLWCKRRKKGDRRSSVRSEERAEHRSGRKKRQRRRREKPWSTFPFTGTVSRWMNSLSERRFVMSEKRNNTIDLFCFVWQMERRSRSRVVRTRRSVWTRSWSWSESTDCAARGSCGGCSTPSAASATTRVTSSLSMRRTLAGSSRARLSSAACSATVSSTRPRTNSITSSHSLSRTSSSAASRPSSSSQAWPSPSTMLGFSSSRDTSGPFPFPNSLLFSYQLCFSSPVLLITTNCMFSVFDWDLFFQSLHLLSCRLLLINSKMHM